VHVESSIFSKRSGARDEDDLAEEVTEEAEDGREEETEENEAGAAAFSEDDASALRVSERFFAAAAFELTSFFCTGV
jgi:hypothetical protein